MKPVKEVPLQVFREVDFEVGISVAYREHRKLVPFVLVPGDNLSFDVYRDERTYMSIRNVEVVNGEYPTAMVTSRAALIPPAGTYRYRLLLRRGDKKHLLAHGPLTVSV